MNKMFRIRFSRFFPNTLKSTIQNQPGGLKWSGISLVAFVLLLVGAPAEAQQGTKVWRIGFLVAGTASSVSDRLEAFRAGLRERGYLEGKNFVIEQRYADGKLDRLPSLVAELVRLKVDVIVTGGAQATRPAKQATSTIPIVMAQDNDPVGSGFVASLARPGGNVTGLSNLTAELSGKQLEILKEIIPKLSRLAVLNDTSEPGDSEAVKETELAAKAFGVQPQFINIKDPNEIEPAFRAASIKRAEALLAYSSAIFNSKRKQIVDLAAKVRLPAIYARAEYVDDGGLMTYGVNTNDLYRRSAIYVDKILKGAKPADFPVEPPVKFDFVINLKTAKQIGLTIPPNVLVRADRVIR